MECKGQALHTKFSRIKQIETKFVRLPGDSLKQVTNIIATNDSIYDIQITGWDSYAAQLSHLEQGSVR